jgi:integrase
VPTFSPHALRHRRISLLHRQGETWAAIGERMGQRSKLVAADTYTHALIDSREVDRGGYSAASERFRQDDGHGDP